MYYLMEHFLYVGTGISVSLQLLFGGIIIGAFLGTLFAIFRHNNKATFFIDRFISIIRGTPLILQLSFIYFSAPGMFGLKLSIVSAGIIAFGLNSSAYFSEILRAGIENLPKGQFEAAKTLNIPSYFLWKDIILPQVLKNIFPALINEVIALLKETALISTIGGMDIMRSAQMLAAEQFTYFLPLCIAACYYYGLVLLIEQLGKIIEQKSSKNVNKATVVLC